jgi:hypothetical protein
LNKNNSNGYGWVKIHKKITQTSFYSNVNATYLAIHLILFSTFLEQRDVTYNRHTISLRRGQYLGGYKRLAKELGWHITTVRRALNVLQDAGFLTLYSNNYVAIITICNYNAYQTGCTESPPNNETGCTDIPPSGAQLDPPLGAQRGHHNKKDNKKDKKEQPMVGIKDYEHLWSLYPKKVGKKVSMRYMKSSIKTALDVEACQRAIVNYKNSNAYQRGFVQYGTTFFNNWKDWVTDPDPGEDPKLKELKELIDAEK